MRIKLPIAVIRPLEQISIVISIFYKLWDVARYSREKKKLFQFLFVISLSLVIG